MPPIQSVTHRMTDPARDIVRRAALAAKRQGNADVDASALLHALALSKRTVGACALECVGWNATLPANDFALTHETVDLDGSPFLVQLTAAAREDAAVLGHLYVGTEHLLLALVRLRPNSVANAETVRREVLEILGHDPEHPAA